MSIKTSSIFWTSRVERRGYFVQRCDWRFLMTSKNFCSRVRKVPVPKEGKKDGALFLAGKRTRRNIARLYEKGRTLGHCGRLLKRFVQQNHVILE